MERRGTSGGRLWGAEGGFCSCAPGLASGQEVGRPGYSAGPASLSHTCQTGEGARDPVWHWGEAGQAWGCKRCLWGLRPWEGGRTLLACGMCRCQGTEGEQSWQSWGMRGGAGRACVCRRGNQRRTAVL